MSTLMTISRMTLGGLLALALLPAFWPGGAAAHTCDDPFSTDLIAGRTIDAGNVEVCNDGTTLTVTYEATFPWCLLETQLHVATIPEPPAEPDANIPQNRSGNPTPDEFAYGDEHDCAGTASFEIPLDEIDGGVSPGDSVVIAAHAKVEDGEREEGAWGKGARFVERGNWATYFEYTVQSPPPACPCAGNIDQALEELLADGAAVGSHRVLGPTYFVDGTCMPTAGNVIPGRFGLILITPGSCELQFRASTPSLVAADCSRVASPRDTAVPFGDANYTNFAVPLAPGEQQECIDYAEQAIGDLVP